MTAYELSKSIEYTLLKPITTQSMVERLCEEAKNYHFACVAVNSYWVPWCAAYLQGSGVGVCTGIGFPLGATATHIKVEETRLAIDQGANEIDVVINIGRAKEGKWDMIKEELDAVIAAAKPAAVAKVILETCYLSDAEKRAICMIATECGADYVKTSTGFGTAGANREDVKLMRSVVGDRAKVKASGGIKTLDDALAMLDAGAVRLGTSNAVVIMEEFEQWMKLKGI